MPTVLFRLNSMVLYAGHGVGLIPYLICHADTTYCHIRYTQIGVTAAHTSRRLVRIRAGRSRCRQVLYGSYHWFEPRASRYRLSALEPLYNTYQPHYVGNTTPVSLAPGSQSLLAYHASHAGNNASVTPRYRRLVCTSLARRSLTPSQQPGVEG